jgi:Flp pilus assembly pilin Flp
MGLENNGERGQAMPEYALLSCLVAVIGLVGLKPLLDNVISYLKDILANITLFIP